MNKELKEKWLERLCTGNKTEMVLCNGRGGYCALGHLVLADGGDFEAMGGGYMPIKAGEELGFTTSLSLSYLRDLGLEVSQENIVMALSDENETFKEVIEYIEENL